MTASEFIARIERAIRVVCDEVRAISLNHDWKGISEIELWEELVACILGSQVSFEVATAATRALVRDGLLARPYSDYKSRSLRQAICAVLSSPLEVGDGERGIVKYRFPVSKTDYICRTAESLHQCCLREILDNAKSGREARKTLVDSCTGIGPKQASLFLRNVGFSLDVAILDAHVLRFMSAIKLVADQVKTVSCLSRYNRIESKLNDYSWNVGYPVGRLDIAIWIVMREVSRSGGLMWLS